MEQEKILIGTQSDKELEKAVLSSMLNSEEVVELAITSLEAKDFTKTEYRILFEKCKEMFSDGIHIDGLTLSTELRQELGNTAFIMDLEGNGISGKGRGSYFVNKLKTLSAEMHASEQTLKYMSGEISRRQLMSALEQDVGKKREVVCIADMVEKNVEQIERKTSGDSEVMGLSTGFKTLDNSIGGLKKGQLVLIAGRPSQGKTLLGVNIAQNVTKMYNIPVLLFSLETLADGITQRILYSEGKVSENNLKGQPDGWKKLTNAAGRLKKSKFHIYDKPDLKAMEMRIVARQFKRKNKDLGLIVIDYAQLVKPDVFTNSDMMNNSEVSKQITRMAKELEIPVIALSQLSRKCEDRPTKEPQLADLRSTGQYEQDADVVILNYYPYNYVDLRKTSENPGGYEQDEIYLIVAKNRDGQLAYLKFDMKGDQKRIVDRQEWELVK